MTDSITRADFDALREAVMTVSNAVKDIANTGRRSHESLSDALEETRESLQGQIVALTAVSAALAALAMAAGVPSDTVRTIVGNVGGALPNADSPDIQAILRTALSFIPDETPEDGGPRNH
ncbi:hypothetical protein [Azospirillum agricola]|uniref:hypothetical protein n=1 Tax=Azospirillum agricola TaxID=1720247 RepID=UPI000A0F23A3|nr:hypothetical protein [Azospirillum agricola]SMH48081.1 hypothetical protein SAMN02982994_2738 [Azospirillum lipoferum]